jgi:hypothetical protein
LILGIAALLAVLLTAELWLVVAAARLLGAPDALPTALQSCMSSGDPVAATASGACAKLTADTLCVKAAPPVPAVKPHTMACALSAAGRHTLKLWLHRVPSLASEVAVSVHAQAV